MLDMVENCTHTFFKATSSFSTQVLLFCTMTTMLDMVESLLDWRGLLDSSQVLRLDGGTAAADRGELIERWNGTGRLHQVK
jgi:SNF2 family DNA or RNA helicase